MRRLVLAAAVAALVQFGTTVLAQDAKLIADGKKVYDSKECAKCHQVAGKGNKIGPLDGVASKLSAAEMRRWLTDTVEMEKTLTKKPKVKMSSKMKVMALTDQHVDALVAYLQTLKE